MTVSRWFVPHCLVAVGVIAAGLSALLFSLREPVAGAALLLTSNFFLALRLIYDTRRGILTADIRLVSLTFYFLYSGTAAWLVLLPTGKQEYPGLAQATLLGALGLIGYNLGLLLLGSRRFTVTPGRERQLARSTFLTPAALGIGLFAFMSYSESVGLDMSFGEIDRSRAVHAVIDQGYIVLRLAMVGVCNYAVLSWRRMNKISRCITACLMGAYITMHVILGNRRDFLPLLLAAICVYSLRRKQRLTFRVVVLGGVVAAGFLAVGVIREHLPGSLEENVVTENEFTVPIQITAFYSQQSFPLHLGETYLRLPAYLVPRAIWAGKPTSLSIQFLADSVGKTEYQGFAYNPVAEGLVNFGVVGPFIVMFCLAPGLNWLAASSGRHVLLYVSCYSMVADFHRGEFALILYQLLVVYGTTFCLTVLARVLPDVTPTAARRQMASPNAPRVRHLSRASVLQISANESNRT